MSDKEEKNSNDEEKTRINQEEGSENPKIITEGNVSLDTNKSLDSNKNAENNGAITENVPLEGAGDDKVRILQDNLELDEIEAELTEMSKDINTDAIKDAGTDTDEVTVSTIDDKKIEDVNTEIDAKVSKTNVTVEKDESNDTSLDKCDEKESKKADDLDEIEDVNTEIDAKVSKTNVTVEDDESNDTSLDKCDEKESKKADDLDEIEDDDIELKWDDDDASNHAMGDDNGNADTKNDDILCEDQLLEDPSDVLPKDKTKMPSDGHPKVSEANLDSDVLKLNSEENSLTRDNSSKEIETTKESEISPKLDIPTDKAKDEKILVDERIDENYLNTEEINSPEMDFSSDESMDRDDINVLEEKLLEKSEIVTEEAVIAPAKEILEEKSIDEPMKETESAKNTLLKEVTIDEQTKDLVAIIEESPCLTESVSNTETESSTLKLKSFTDVILNKDNDDIMSEEKLLEELDSKDESSLIISEKDIECSKIVPEKEAPIYKEDHDVALLEEKLLQETETAGVIPESDITMDVDEEEEGELLKDDECPEDSSILMDVDNTDTSIIGDKAEIEEKLTGKIIKQSEVVRKDIALPIDDQTNIEKVDEVQNMDQSDDQSGIIEKVIDQPIKDTCRAVDIVDDTPVEDEVKIDEEIVDQAVSEKEKIDEQTVSVIETIDQQIDDQPVSEKETINQQIDDQAVSEKERINQEIDDQPVSEKETINQQIDDQAVSEKERIDQQIDDKNKMEDSNKDQLILESNTKERSIESLVQTDALTVSNVLVEDLQIKTDSEELEENTEDINKDTGLDKPEKSKETVNPDIILDIKEEVDEISPNNSSIFLEDLCPIKTDHGVHKPDVMLEIPTQELIDIDDTDLSMNLDHSVMSDSFNDDEKNADDDIVHEKTIDETVVDDVIGSDNIVTDDAAVSEKSVEQTKADDDTVKVKPVDQKALVTESTDKIIAEDDTEKPVDQKDIDAEMTTFDKIIADDDIVKEKSVDQKDTDAEMTTVEKIIADDDTVKEKSVYQKDIDAEMTTVDKIIADDDTVKEKPVDQKALVTESTDKIIAEDDTEKPVDQKDIDAEMTTVDKIIADDGIVKEKLVDQKDIDAEMTTVDKIIADDDTVKEKSVDQETIVTETTAVDKIIADEDTVKQKSVVQEAIVTESPVSKVQTERNIAESHKKAEDTVTESTVSKVQTERNIVESHKKAEDTITESTVSKVQTERNIVESHKKAEDTVIAQATVEENMERLFADDDLEVAKEIAECIASTSEVQVPAEQPPASVTRMTPDTSDEVPEIDDTLGLLAESAGRMMEDDEEPDDDFDGDDDEDFDQDESSTQISAEQSEDSNPAAPESVRNQKDKELETPDPKDEEFMLCDSTSQDKAEKMDVEEEYGTVELHAETINEMNEEAKSAVDALLNADNPASEQVQDQQVTTEPMDIETVKLSDTSDNEVEVEPTEDQQAVAEPNKEAEEKQKRSPSKSSSKSNISPKQSPSKLSQSPSKQSPSKMKNLAITAQAPSAVVNIVYLEESSSSEDDIQEVEKPPEPETTEDDKPPSPQTDVTNVNIPTGIEIMCTSGGSMSEITTKDNLSQVVISGVPKPPPHKPARLNTSEVTIKTVSNTEPLIIPETKINELTQTQSKPKLSLEIFSLDSDDDESVAKEKPSPKSPQKMTALELEKARETSKCINYCCTSDNKVPHKLAEASVVAYYDAGRKRRSMVCQTCADVVAARSQNLIQGIKDLTPLVDLDMGKLSQDLVEISDSESEDEVTSTEEPKESIGEKGAKFIEENLAKYLNDTWKKYDMDTRLKETQIMLDDEIEKLEQDSKEIDAMLNECQIATDKLRCELYATFECQRQKLPSLIIYDTPESKYIGLENVYSTSETVETRQAKRRLSSLSETPPAKRPAIPLGYAPLDGGDSKEKAAIHPPDIKLDDDKDISVVKLSAEAAPADLPPPGEISRPPLRTGMPVYAMKNAFGPWLRGRVVEIQPKNTSGGNPFTVCLVKFDHKTKTNGKVLHARCIAYAEPADVRMTIGTRLIALFKDSNKRESYYSGVVAEIPNPVNNYRYLVFFDDGYAQYVQHQFTRLVCECSNYVWEEVHPFSREFVRKYLTEYPERPMVRLHGGQHLKTEWNGQWWPSRVTRVDASLAQVLFVGDGRREWIYRGSTRLAPLYLELRAAERHRPRPMPRSKAQPRSNMPYVEYTRSDEQEAKKQVDAQALQLLQQQLQLQQQQQKPTQNEEIRSQRAVARKSTSALPHVLPPSQQDMTNDLDTSTSRVVYYTPKNAVKPLKMVPHRCGPKCRRSDVLSLKELRTYNPLAKPLLSGWERQIVRFKGHREVMYRAPCGRRLRNMRELHHYLRSIDSDLPVDLFDFHYSTHCLAEFVLTKCVVGKRDLSHGKENVPIPCVNSYDDSLPEFCSYNTERTPTAGVPLNLEPEFLCGCDCTDDCQDKTKCACWKMTLEGARTIGLRGPNLGYVYKRLPEPLPSGIYECNSRCKCKHTCLNRVAQHPLQLKLQVFKTPNRGWGIRALNDVPKGSFLCVYAGNLLTDATANLDGLNEGDEYLAELDYIEVVEQMKEGYEEDIPEADKKIIKKERKEGDDSDEDEPSSSEDEETADKTDKEDDDFRPGYIGLGVTEFNKRLRKRESMKEKENATGDEKEKDKDTAKDTTKEPNAEEECITISDDEEVREPSRFMAQTNMGANEYISKYKSVRTLFGEDEACYIMDAKVQGNIGRYLNHSCCPNVFVQNVFVDTHDPRFPWVAFFALSHIKSGTELTWNYNYDVGSVPGKVLYCYCGAANCRGRLL